MSIKERLPQHSDGTQEIEKIPHGIYFERFLPAKKLSVPELLPFYGEDPEVYPFVQKLGPTELYEADPETETYVAEEIAENLVRKTGITPDIIVVTTSHLPFGTSQEQHRANHVRQHLSALDLPKSVEPEDPANTRTVSTACSGAVVALDLLRNLDEDHDITGQNVLLIAEETGYRRTLLPPEHDTGKSGLLFSDAAIAMQFTYGEDLTVISSIAPQYEPDESHLFMRTPEYDENDPFLLVCSPPFSENFSMNGPELLKYFRERISLQTIVEQSYPPFNQESIDYVLTHQASARMVDKTFGTLGFPNAKGHGRGIYKYGNTSSASTLFDLQDGLQSGAILPRDNVLMVGYGAGLTWASAVVRIGS